MGWADYHLHVMIPSADNPTILWGDPEHAGIRLLLLPLLLTGYLLGYYLLRVLLNALTPESDFITLISCVGGLPLGLGFSYAGESLLKRFWRSRRALVLDGETIQLQVNLQTARRLQTRRNLDLLCWSFPLDAYPRGGRERRAPRRWLCLACQLRQGDERLIAFTFAAPEAAAELMAAGDFRAIDPADVYDTSLSGRMTQPTVRPTIPSEVLAGKDGKFWVAERYRWQEGIELMPADLGTLLAYVRQAQAT